MAKISRLALYSCVVFFCSAGVAQAEVRSNALRMADEQDYRDVTSMRVAIPVGLSNITINIAQQIQPADVSIWYAPSSRCSEFAIRDVRYGDVEGALSVASANFFDGTTHFRLPQPTKKLVVTVSTNRFLGMVCDIHLKAASFAVPTNITMLARLVATCTTDNACSFDVDRMDTPTMEVTSVSEADVKAFHLVPGKIYKLTGYIVPKPADSNAADIFKILESREVL